MASRSISYFVKRALAVILPVPLLLICLYVADDPFLTIRKYDDYYTSHQLAVSKSTLNLRFIEREIERGSAPDAFILGSSLSENFHVDDWLAIIGPNHHAMHFDSSNERPEGIADKMEWLAEHTDSLTNVLIVVNPSQLDGSYPLDLTNIEPPRLTNYRTLVSFHSTFFRAGMNYDFLTSYIPYRLTGRMADHGKWTIFPRENAVFDSYTNEIRYPAADSAIAADAAGYAASHGVISMPDTLRITEYMPVIKGSRRKAFERIASAARRKGTAVKLIITPGRDGKVLCDSDDRVLRNILGSGNVANLGRSHAADVFPDTLYYDRGHFRPALARRFLRAAYHTP